MNVGYGSPPAEAPAVRDLVEALADAAVRGEAGVTVEEGGAARGGEVVGGRGVGGGIGRVP